MRNDAARPLHGFIAGASPQQRAIAIAGFLAEQGIRSISVQGAQDGGSTMTPSARKTDLPAVLCAQPSWVLKAPGLEIQGDPSLARWTTQDPSLADAIRAISAPR